MDVAIISCQECFFSRNAEAHVKGFFERMVSPDNKKMEITVQSYDLRDMDHHAVAAEVHRAKVQIVIVSHHFLDRLKHEATMRKKLSPINRVLRSKRVISILLGMSSQEIIEGYQVVLARFHEWFSVELRSTSKLDPEFCRKFTEQVVRIYNVELTNTSNFSVFPKKITKDQQKVAILLKKPLENKDQLRIELSRGRDTEILTEIFSCNPYSALIRIPDTLCVERTALIEITMYINQQKVGTKLIKYEYSTKNGDDDPIERMTHSVPGFLKFLDDTIAESLSTNIRAGTSYTTDPSLELMNDVLLCRGDEIPGVMHFAAYYGLEKTMWAMLELGDGLTQSNSRNSSGKTPLDIAKERGHLKLLQTIKDYQDVTNTYEAIQLVKDLYKKNKETIIIVDRPKENGEHEPVNEDIEEEEIIGTVSSETSVDVDEAAMSVKENEQENNYVPETALLGDAGASPVSSNGENYLSLAPKPTSRKILPKKTEYINLKPEELAEIARQERLDRRQKEKRESPPPEKPPRVDNSLVKLPPASPNLNYDTPRFISEEYSIPPTPRPVKQTSPVLIHKTDAPIHNTSGYIIMEPSEERTSKLADPEDPSQRLPPTPEEEISSLDYPVPTLRHPHKDPDRRTAPRPIMNISPSHPQPKNVSPVPVFDPTEEALIDLMNDFKNNVYSIRELELLFENWKDRSDVKRSMEEKENDLKKMRDDYNRIREEGTRSKKSSAFDKIKRIFPGGKKKLSNASLADNSSMMGSSSYLAGEDSTNSQFPNYPMHTASPGPFSPADRLDSLKPSSLPDRTSFESGGSAAGPDSGISDPDSDKDKERENKDCATNMTDVWTDVLTKRFIASYIGPNPLAFKDGVAQDPDAKEEASTPPITPAEDDGMYKVPPMPRPVQAKPLPKPYPPMEPTNPISPTIAVAPPPPPKNKFFGRSASKVSREETISPPPPPPRNYKAPNVFNYIDYRNKSTENKTPELPKKPGAPEKSPVERSRIKTYENTGKKISRDRI